MNLKSICFYISLFCFPISFLAFVNILYSSYFDYFLSIESYFITLVLSLIIGLCLFYLGKNADKKINFFDQLILVILVYLFIGSLISIPFYLSNSQVSFLNSFFESISGLTGTGFTTLKSIKYLDPTLILWRSSSQWLGGLYFILFNFIIFNNKFNYKMTYLTYSADNNNKSEENIKNLILKFLFFTDLSVIYFSLFNISGMRLFNSLNLTMTLVSNGGFLPSDSLSDIIFSNFQKSLLIIFIFF